MIGKIKYPKLRRHVALKLEPILYGRIEMQAKARDRSVSYTVRMAIVEWLDAQETGSPPIAGADKISSPARVDKPARAAKGRMRGP